MIRRPPRSPLFPSTPLFRSRVARAGDEMHRNAVLFQHVPERRHAAETERLERPGDTVDVVVRAPPPVQRSEEHTSELQSPCNLVCRLLLEKKKKTAARILKSDNVRPHHLSHSAPPFRSHDDRNQLSPPS